MLHAKPNIFVGMSRIDNLAGMKLLFSNIPESWANDLLERTRNSPGFAIVRHDADSQKAVFFRYERDVKDSPRGAVVCWIWTEVPAQQHADAIADKIQVRKGRINPTNAANIYWEATGQPGRFTEDSFLLPEEHSAELKAILAKDGELLDDEGMYNIEVLVDQQVKQNVIHNYKELVHAGEAPGSLAAMIALMLTMVGSVAQLKKGNFDILRSSLERINTKNNGSADDNKRLLMVLNKLSRMAPSDQTSDKKS